MKPLKSRLSVPLLVSCMLGTIGLFAAQPALAAKALFRVQRSFLGAPFPPVTYPQAYGGAGRYINYVEPYKPFTRAASFTMSVQTGTQGPGAGTSLPPGTATVVTANPIGAKFTLPSSFVDFAGTFTLFPSTAFTGYLSKSILDYRNLEGRFRPSNPYGATMNTTITFSDIVPGGTTTTHGGLFDFSRNGYMKIEPGPNRFGGTMRLLNAPPPATIPGMCTATSCALFYQYISAFAPLFFKGYGSFACTKMGNNCATKSYEQEFEAISSGMVSRFLLGTTVFTYATPTANGKTQYRKIQTPYAVTKNYYLDLSGPWSTGKLEDFIPPTGAVTSGYGVHPTASGYDKSLGGADITLIRTYTSVLYKGKGATYYPYVKYYTTLKGVTRVVSLVRPRILHVYQVPRIPADPIFSNYAAPRIQRMKVFFLPEPGAMLMLGSGIVGLAGLVLLRRR